MKKLLVLIFCMLLLSTISAMEWDNIKEYNSETKTTEIYNSWIIPKVLKGDKVADITLKTPQMNNVIDIGNEKQLVAEKEINNLVKRNSDFVGGMDFYDMKRGMEKFDRDYEIRYKVKVGQEEVVDYGEVCENKIANGTTTQFCTTKKVGTHFEDKYEWRNIKDLKELPKGKITIGLFVDVKKGETVEWIPEYFGVRINEWAGWTEGLNTGLNAYYSFEETGDTIVDITNGENNMTNYGTDRQQPGKIDYSVYFDGGTDEIKTTSGFNMGSTPLEGFTFQAWLNGTDFSSIRQILHEDDNIDLNCDFRDTAPGRRIYCSLVATGVNSEIDWTGGSSVEDRWIHFVYTAKPGNETAIWINGTKVATSSFGSDFNVGGNNLVQLGEANTASLEWQGHMDEVGFWNRTLSDAEIIDLYNDGDGLDYTKPTVTLNIPADKTKQTSSLVTFGCNVTDDIGIRNITLYLNGSANETIDVANVTSYNWTTSMNLIDAEWNWTCLAYDNATTPQGAWADSNWTLTIDAINPELNISYPTPTIDYHIAGTNLTLNWTVNDSNLDTCLWDYNGYNTTLVCGANTTSFNITSSTNKTGIFYVNDTLGNKNVQEISWNYRIFQNEVVYNVSTTEGKVEGFLINVTANSSLTDVDLIYNGTSYSTTQTDDAWKRTITVPIGTTANNFTWNFTYAGDLISSNEYSQTVSGFSFGICNSTLTVPFLNFTFKDEADLTNINASNDLTDANFWTGDPSLSKSYTFTNSSENPSYAFCFSPAGERVNLNMSFKYSATGYPLRTLVYDTTEFTNSTTNETLYLLASADGVYQEFIVLSQSQQVISGVEVIGTREISGETVTVAQGTTDGSGSISFWLNPDYVHHFNFTKSGYPDYDVSYTPVGGDPKYITLGSSTTPAPIDDLTKGITQTIYPTSNFLQKNSSYNFSYTIASTYWTLDSYGFILKYQNGTEIGEQTGSSEAGSTLELEANTSTQSRIIMNYYYVINDTYTNFTRVWNIYETNDYSLNYFFTRVSTYINADLFGVLGDDEGQFSKALLSVLIIILVCGTLTFKYGIASEAAIMGIMTGIILFLNNIDLLPNLAIFENAVLSFGDLLVYIMLIITIGFIIKEERR